LSRAPHHRKQYGPEVGRSVGLEREQRRRRQVAFGRIGDGTQGREGKLADCGQPRGDVGFHVYRDDVERGVDGQLSRPVRRGPFDPGDAGDPGLRQGRGQTVAPADIGRETLLAGDDGLRNHEAAGRQPGRHTAGNPEAHHAQRTPRQGLVQ